MGGQRRKAIASERSMAILLGGALTGVLAVCAIAGLFILKNASANGPDASASVSPRSHQVAAASPTFVPFNVVPDPCVIMDGAVAEELVPGGSATNMLAGDSDREAKCGWGDIGRNDTRELSIELRAEAGTDPIASAGTRFADEWETDQSGESLPSGDKLKYKEPLEGTGDAAYELYLLRGGAAEAVVNARVGNVLITVRYGGRAGQEKPLSQDKALEGAREAAKIVAGVLAKGAEQ